MHTLALEPLYILTECYAPMLRPVLKILLARELAVEIKMQQVAMSPKSKDVQGHGNERPKKKNAETLKRLLAFLHAQVQFNEKTEQ